MLNTFNNSKDSVRKIYRCLTALFLMVALIYSCFVPYTAYADSNEDELNNEASALKTLGLFNSADTKYNFGGQCTIAEGAVFLVRLLGKEEVAKNLKYVAPFSDIPGWASAHIGYLYLNKIINRQASGKLEAKKSLTAGEYAAWLLRTIGYDDKKGDFNLDKSLDAVKSIGLLSGDENVFKKEHRFTRGDMLDMSFKALFVKQKHDKGTLLDSMEVKGTISGELIKKSSIMNIKDAIMGIQAIQHHYITDKGILISGFEDLTDTDIIPNPTYALSADKKHFTEGVQGGKLTVSEPGDSASIDFAFGNMRVESISFRLYIEDITRLKSIYVNLTNSKSNSNYFSKTIKYSYLKNGWNNLKLTSFDMQQNGLASWSEAFNSLRIGETAADDEFVNITWDDIRVNEKSIPKVVFTFDGCWSDIYNIAYPIMKEKNFKGIEYVQVQGIGVKNRMSLEQVKKLQDEGGWEIGNHTVSHPDMTKLTETEIYDEINRCKQWQEENNIASGEYHFAYPSGHYDARVEKVLLELGFKTARTIEKFPLEMPVFNMMQLSNDLQLTSKTTFDECKKKVDRAKRNGSTLFIFLHSVSDSPVVVEEAKTEVFQKLVDYIYNQNIDVVTMSEWYDGYNR